MFKMKRCPLQIRRSYAVHRALSPVLCHLGLFIASFLLKKRAFTELNAAHFAGSQSFEALKGKCRKTQNNQIPDQKIRVQPSSLQYWRFCGCYSR